MLIVARTAGCDGVGPCVLMADMVSAVRCVFDECGMCSAEVGSRLPLVGCGRANTLLPCDLIAVLVGPAPAAGRAGSVDVSSGRRFSSIRWKRDGHPVS